MKVLAIDPGTSCGYAWAEANHESALRATAARSGFWDLKPHRHEGGGMRYLRLRGYLHKIAPNVVVYEEVRRHLGTDAAHIYGGIIGEIGSFCELHNIPYTAIPVGTVKKHATGKGNASKEAMLEAAIKQFGSPLGSHDQADALWILDAYLAGLAG
jgi:Holliday junction resolvasome RuvABC endonuclease subunit